MTVAERVAEIRTTHRQFRTEVRRGLAKLDRNDPDYMGKAVTVFRSTREKLGMPPCPEYIKFPSRPTAA